MSWGGQRWVTILFSKSASSDLSIVPFNCSCNQASFSLAHLFLSFLTSLRTREWPAVTLSIWPWKSSCSNAEGFSYFPNCPNWPFYPLLFHHTTWAFIFSVCSYSFLTGFFYLLPALQAPKPMSHILGFCYGSSALLVSVPEPVIYCHASAARQTTIQPQRQTSRNSYALLPALWVYGLCRWQLGSAGLKHLRSAVRQPGDLTLLGEFWGQILWFIRRNRGLVFFLSSDTEL